MFTIGTKKGGLTHAYEEGGIAYTTATTGAIYASWRPYDHLCILPLIK